MTSEQGAQDGLPLDDAWHRVSPASIIYFAVQFLGHIAKGGWQTMAPLAGALVAAGEKRWMVLAFGVPGLLLVIGIAGLLSYLHFRFRMNGGAFLIQKGVIQRKRLTLAYERIQNVVINEPIYFRPFGLVALGLESAGSSAEEVSLAGIPRRLAEDIRRVVLLERAKPGAAQPEAAASSDEAPTGPVVPILHQGIGELVRYGLSNNNVWVFAGLAAAALSQAEDQLGNIIDSGIGDQVTDMVGTGTAALVLFGFLSVAGLLLLLMLASIAGAIIAYYDYKLSHEGKRFLRSKGLFERSETSLPDSKIQSLLVDRPWPAILLNRSHLVFRQVGFQSTGQDAAAPSKKFIVPSVTDTKLRELVGLLTPELQAWDNIRLKAISRRFISRVLTYNIAMPATLAAIGTSIGLGPIGLVILLVPLLMSPFVYLRWRQYGYWSDGKHGVVRKGLVGHSLRLFAFHKVQTVTLHQSPGQRRHDLATLTIELAGNSITVPYMPLDEARAWHDEILKAVATDRRAWM
ncbi:MAG: hypothetical protein EP335_02850 [Alphaproteobacteria bacterium]|nr:MAG: hypothetical protein EP335_02850 [Alphaproteobacteria bacterium]